MDLSVIIIVLQGGDKLARCLGALTQQVTSVPGEIVVPYDQRHSDIARMSAEFPGVEFIPVEGKCTYAELRSVALRAARGSIVAVTEDHCIPEPGWVHEILRAHEQPYGAIGGAVEKAAPDSALNWSLYLVDYVRYANPISAGVVHHLTDCNVSYKRSALTQIEGVWRKEFHEPEVHASLEAAGHDLSFSPRIVVRQQRSMGFREAIRDRYEFGRLFGGRRAAGVALSRRLSYIMASFFLPVLLTGRVAVHVLRRKRYMGAFLRALPFALLLNTTWAWGEFIGYLTRQAGRSLKLDQEA